jgi:hypothetical protein
MVKLLGGAKNYGLFLATPDSISLHDLFHIIIPCAINNTENELGTKFRLGSVHLPHPSGIADNTRHQESGTQAEHFEAISSELNPAVCHQHS